MIYKMTQVRKYLFEPVSFCKQINRLVPTILFYVVIYLLAATRPNRAVHPLGLFALQPRKCKWAYALLP